MTSDVAQFLKQITLLFNIWIVKNSETQPCVIYSTIQIIFQSRK